MTDKNIPPNSNNNEEDRIKNNSDTIEQTSAKEDSRDNNVTPKKHAPMSETNKTTQATSENQTNTEQVKTSNKTTAKNTAKKTTTDKSNQSRIPKVAIISLILTIALGGAGYYYGQRIYLQQQHEISLLNQQVNLLKQSIAANNQLMKETKQLIVDNNAKIQENRNKLGNLSHSVDAQEKNLFALNEKFIAISAVDTNSWLISQTDYLVKLAYRKIWSEQDFASALVLLKSADASLVKANDPSLLPARQAINNDITLISNISHVDYTGIVLRLNSLADRVLELPLANDNNTEDDNHTDYYDHEVNDNGNTTTDTAEAETAAAPSIAENESPATESDEATKSTELSSSWRDWKDNLLKSAKRFSKDFISIKPRQPLQECLAQAKSEQEIRKCSVFNALLPPEQIIYLRENLRSQLFIAAQATDRREDQIYHNAIESVDTWVRAYFDASNTSTKVFLADLASLSKETLAVQLPERLSSMEALDKLMNSRVYKSLSKPLPPIQEQSAEEEK